MSVHDLVTLGEFRKALLLHDRDSTTPNVRKLKSDPNADPTALKKYQEQQQRRDELLRLPLFLRLLSASQPLAGIPTILGKSSDSKGKVTPQLKSSPPSCPPSSRHRHADEIVPVLEKVAASFPLAEGVDVLVSYLAPQLCRSISRCAEVKRKRRRVFNLLGPSPPQPPLLPRDDGDNKNIAADATAGSRQQQQGRVVIDGCLIPSLKCGGSFVISGFNTKELTVCVNGGKKVSTTTEAKRPMSSPERKKKRKKRKLEASSSKTTTDKHADKNNDTSANSATPADIDIYADAEDDDTLGLAVIEKKKNEAKVEKSKTQTTTVIADEDSQRSNVQRILTEIVTLVASSLADVHVVHAGRRQTSSRSVSGGIEDEDKATMEEDPSAANSNAPTASSPDKNNNAVNNRVHYNINPTSLAQNEGVALGLKPDSLLAEPPTSSSHHNTNNIDSFSFSNTDLDLSATIPCLMHHTSVLRHQHLSNALCRAAAAAGAGASQIPKIIQRCAANCPVASQALVRGCLDAYSATEYTEDGGIGVGVGTGFGYGDGSLSSKEMIKKCVKDSLRAIASLSTREKSHVIFVLNRSRILPDVMLELMIDMSKDDEGGDDDSAVVTILGDLLACIRRKIAISDKKKNEIQSINDDMSPIRRNLRNNNADKGAHRNTATIASGSNSNSNGSSSDSIKKRPPHRRRRIRQRNKTPSSQPMQYVKSEEEEWILHALQQDKKLSEKIRYFLRSNLPSSPLEGNDDGGEGEGRTLNVSRGQIVWGKSILYVRAIGLLIHLVGIGDDAIISSSSSQFVEGVMHSLIFPTLAIDTGTIAFNMHIVAQSDEFVRLSICVCLLILSQLPAIEGKDQGVEDVKESHVPAISTKEQGECIRCLCKLLHHLHVSITEDKRNTYYQEQGGVSLFFLTRISRLIRDKDAIGLMYLILRSVAYGSGEENADEFVVPPEALSCLTIFTACESKGNGESEEKANKFQQVCEFLASDPDISKVLQRVDETIEKKSFPSGLNVITFMERVQNSQIEDSRFDSIMSSLFRNAEQCLVIYENDNAALLLETAVEVLAKRTPVAKRIPLVLPLDLDSLCRAIYFQKIDDDGMGIVKSMCQCEIQTLYALLFMDKIPDSPFAIDPRALPLDQMLRQRYKSRKSSFSPRTKHSTSSVRAHLEALIYKYCPEVLDYTTEISPLRCPHYCSTALVDATPLVVAKAIRKCTLSNDDEHSINDSEGLLAERLYLQARTYYPASSVDREATTALLTTYANRPSLPGVTGSYAGLVRDPLLLLKCTVKAWKRKGLRRIILVILHRLLESNEVLVRGSHSSEEVVMEYLAARDLIVLRCCLVVGSGGVFDYSKKTAGKINCSMIVSMARFMVRKRPGLAAAVIKQGLPEVAVDWLVEFVPESLADAKILTRILEKRELTAVEKLVTADAALRIAIAHGSRNEIDSQPLAYVALSLLVSSFFLVIGPVGVPVNVTCEERSGQDITLSCRRAMFRMLSALQGITGIQTCLKSEALLALTKLAGLCKNDGNGSGLTGTAAKKRNILMKDIWDTLVRTISTLGGGVQI